MRGRGGCGGRGCGHTAPHLGTAGLPQPGRPGSAALSLLHRTTLAVPPQAPHLERRARIYPEEDQQSYEVEEDTRPSSEGKRDILLQQL